MSLRDGDGRVRKRFLNEVMAVLRDGRWRRLGELREELNAAQPRWAFWRRWRCDGEVLTVLHALEDLRLVGRGPGYPPLWGRCRPARFFGGVRP